MSKTFFILTGIFALPHAKLLKGFGGQWTFSKVHCRGPGAVTRVKIF